MNDHLWNVVAAGSDFSSDTTLLPADLHAKKLSPKIFQTNAADGSDTRKSSHCAS